MMGSQLLERRSALRPETMRIRSSIQLYKSIKLSQYYLLFFFLSATYDCISSYSKVEIDYDKLRRLCTRFPPNERYKTSNHSFFAIFMSDIKFRIDHSTFMREYPSIFTRTMKRTGDLTLCMPRARPHTCYGTSMTQ